MIVFVVEDRGDSFETYSVDAVFSTREVADQHAARLENRGRDTIVSEFRVEDCLPPEPEAP